jgi:hypothetical protein
VHDKGDVKTAIQLSRAALDTYTRALVLTIRPSRAA